MNKCLHPWKLADALDPDGKFTVLPDRIDDRLIAIPAYGLVAAEHQSLRLLVVGICPRRAALCAYCRDLVSLKSGSVL